jgi:MFS family permease
MLLSLVIQNQTLAVIVLALGFAASDFMLPSCWAVSLDVGKENAGTISGAMNTAGQMGATIAAAAYGRLAEIYGWNLPLIGIAGLFFLTGLIWLKIDPTQPVVSEARPHGSAQERAAA